MKLRCPKCIQHTGKLHYVYVKGEKHIEFKCKTCNLVSWWREQDIEEEKKDND